MTSLEWCNLNMLDLQRDNNEFLRHVSILCWFFITAAASAGTFLTEGEGVGITSQGDERLQPRRNAWCPSAFFTLLRLSRYDLKHPQVVLKLLQCTLLCVVRLKVP